MAENDRVNDMPACLVVATSVQRKEIFDDSLDLFVATSGPSTLIRLARYPSNICQTKVDTAEMKTGPVDCWGYVRGKHSFQRNRVQET